MVCLVRKGGYYQEDTEYGDELKEKNGEAQEKMDRLHKGVHERKPEEPDDMTANRCLWHAMPEAGPVHMEEVYR